VGNCAYERTTTFAPDHGKTVISQISPRKEAEVPRVNVWVRAGITSAAIAITALVASAHGQQSLHITLRDGTKLMEADTRLSTVKELLSEKHIQLTKMDHIAPSLTSKLTNGMTIKITRKRIDTVTEVTSVPFRISRVYSDGMRAGTSQTLVAGVNGSKSVTFEDTFINDQCVNRKKLNVSLKPAVPAVIKEGVRGIHLVSRGATSRRTLTMIATGYSASENRRWGGKTATGRPARFGVVAVDPRFIKLGTRVYVEGYGIAIAADTGGAIKGRRIDLCFNSRAEAMRVGRKPVKVTILK
jgi:3D (Asp-Asp-Asp) domain-containing protein